MTITPIETQYAGCRFRSRLEARWAVFFDHLGIRWKYEPQGYAVGPDQRPYLPDFHLPAVDLWVEVKGSEDHLDVELIARASVPYNGLPGRLRWSDHDVRLMILGPIGQAGPLVDRKTGERVGFSQPIHTALAFRKGDIYQWGAYFTGDGLVNLVEQNSLMANDSPEVFWDTRGTAWGNLVGGGFSISNTDDEQLAAAYRAARSARFEHGQSGAPSGWHEEKSK